MVRRDYIEICRERFESRFASVETLCAMQEQQWFAPAAAAQMQFAVANVDFGVLQPFPPVKFGRGIAAALTGRIIVRFLSFSEVVNDAGWRHGAHMRNAIGAVG